MATIVIEIDGVDVTDQIVFGRTRFTSVADGNVGTCEIVIDDQDQTYDTGAFGTGDTIELFVDGQREWDGWIFEVGRTWPLQADETVAPSATPRFWVLKGQDRNLLFQKRILFRQDDPADSRGFPDWPEDTPDKTIINHYMANYVDLSGDGIDVVSGIEQIASPNPFEDALFAYVSAPMGVLFEEISQMTGGVYFIDPGRVLRYVDDITPTAPYVLSDTPTGAEVGYRDLDAALEYAHAANEALVWGTGKGSDKAVFAKYTNAQAVSDYGLWQWGDHFPGAWKQVTVNRRARTYVIGSPSHRRGHDEPVPVVRCQVFTPGIRAGHVVDFKADLFSYQEPLPVRNVVITFPTPTGIRYELELTLKVDVPFGIPDLYPLQPWPPWPPFPGLDEPPPTGGPSGGALIDHYDRIPQLWTKEVKEVTEKGEWDVQLPIVPDGIQEGDLIFIHWTHTPVPDGPSWTPVDMPFVSGYSTSVRKIWDSDPLQFYLFSELNSYMIPGSPIGGRYLTVTSAMDFIGQVAPNIKLFADSGETTKVAYVSGVLRGSSGLPENGNLPAVTNFNDPVLSIAVNDTDLYGGDDYMYFAFAVLGGNDDQIGGSGSNDGTPLTVGQNFTGTVLSSDQTVPFSMEQVNLYPDQYHPAFGLAVARSSQEVGPYGYWQGISKVDGYQVDDATVAWGIRVDQQATLGVLPDQSVTGSSYTGGNPYVLDGPATDWGLLSSRVYVAGSWKSFKVRDYRRVITKDVGGEEHGLGEPNTITDPDPGTYPLMAWSKTNETLMRFRFAGVGADRDGYIYLLFSVLRPDPGAYSDDCQEVSLGIYWYQETGADVTYVEADNAVYLGTGATDSGDVYSWVDTTSYLNIAPDTDYLVRMDFGTADRLRMRYWEEGTDEPGTWQVDIPWIWYKTNDPYRGLRVGNESYNEMNIAVAAKSGSSTGVSYIDAFWEYGTLGEDVVWFPTTHYTVYGTASANASTGLYTTPYPYQANTLVVYADGVRLRNGVDYIETDPSSGEFRLLGSFDLSASITTSYTRAGDATSTDVYVTGLAYEPGTLVVYVDGVALIAGTDYVEVDPTSGRFRLLVDPGDGVVTTAYVQESVYTTESAYLTGSLVVYLDGVPLVAGVGFEEVDPGAGTFRLLIDEGEGIVTSSYLIDPGGLPVSGEVAAGLVVTDETATSAVTNIYRPSGPQALAYGWGTALDGYNSLFASSALALERHTGGTYSAFAGTPRSTPPEHRSQQTDQQQYADADVLDAAAAWQSGWSETMEHVGDMTWAGFESLIDEGRGAILMGMYEDMPTAKRYSTRTGVHTVYVNERFSNGNYLVYDPIRYYATIYTASELQSFAVGFPATGLVRAGFTQVT